MIIIYDIESYPNYFSFAAVDVATGNVYYFEISHRIDQSAEFRQFINHLATTPGSVMIGFNNIQYDYPVIHRSLCSECSTVETIYYISKQIIETPWDDRFKNLIWESEHLVPQIDLFKIHHFDNVARFTSLKVLQFNMRSDSVEDLPIKPGTNLTFDEMETLKVYNIHDITETWRFYIASKDQIDFRKKMSREHDHNMMNYSDGKIGAFYFVKKLEQAGVSCYTTNPRNPIQTLRTHMDLSDAVLPYLSFDQPEFQRILDWFKGETICNTKGVFEDVNCTINNFTFVFGLGGIHGSVESKAIISDSEYAIVDLDVTSYYPNLAITQKFYPEHLTEKFCDVYKELFEERRSNKKGSPEYAMLKLALNVVYGLSNNAYSPFYDSLFTMKITINGQLLLCKLAEMLMVGNVELIQVNTDGLTIKVHRSLLDWVDQVCRYWEQYTHGLQLEKNEYSRMFIRDVNNYVAEYTDGKLKRKGAYGYGKDLDWNQNHSSQVIAKAVESNLIFGTSVRQFIETHDDLSDYFILAKIPKSSRLVIDYGEGDRELQNTTRYYVSTMGGNMTKIMPPLPKKPGIERRFAVAKGWKVQPYNDTREPVPAPVNYEYYIQEAEKLIKGAGNA